jgi:hypothetical protein
MQFEKIVDLSHLDWKDSTFVGNKKVIWNFQTIFLFLQKCFDFFCFHSITSILVGSILSPLNGFAFHHIQLHGACHISENIEPLRGCNRMQPSVDHGGLLTMISASLWWKNDTTNYAIVIFLIGYIAILFLQSVYYCSLCKAPVVIR